MSLSALSKSSQNCKLLLSVLGSIGLVVSVGLSVYRMTLTISPQEIIGFAVLVIGNLFLFFRGMDKLLQAFMFPKLMGISLLLLMSLMVFAVLLVDPEILIHQEADWLKQGCFTILFIYVCLELGGVAGEWIWKGLSERARKNAFSLLDKPALGASRVKVITVLALGIALMKLVYFIATQTCPLWRESFYQPETVLAILDTLSLMSMSLAIFLYTEPNNTRFRKVVIMLSIISTAVASNGIYLTGVLAGLFIPTAANRQKPLMRRALSFVLLMILLGVAAGSGVIMTTYKAFLETVFSTPDFIGLALGFGLLGIILGLSGIVIPYCSTRNWVLYVILHAGFWVFGFMRGIYGADLLLQTVLLIAGWGLLVKIVDLILAYQRRKVWRIPLFEVFEIRPEPGRPF